MLLFICVVIILCYLFGYILYEVYLLCYLGIYYCLLYRFNCLHKTHIMLNSPSIDENMFSLKTHMLLLFVEVALVKFHYILKVCPFVSLLAYVNTQRRIYLEVQ